MLHEKTCTQCGETKSVTEFRKDARNKDGRQGACKVCGAESCRKWRAANREKVLASKRKWYAANREADCERLRASRAADPEKTLLKSAQHRAKKYGREFDITRADIVIPSHCPVLGFPLEIGGGTDNSPSLDRIDSTRGYVKGNVAVISWRANSIKKDGTATEHRAIANWMDSQ